MTASTSFLGDKPVHRIGFGAMQLAGPGVFGPPADPDAALAVLRRAVELGVDHIDTSQYYGPDVVNALIREALHPYPEGLRLVTKVGAERDSKGGWNQASEPHQLKAQVEDNLRALGIDRIDLVNLRRFERDDPNRREPALEDQLAALADLRDAGSIDMIGVSNVTAETVRTAIDTVGIGEVQNPFSILDRSDADARAVPRARRLLRPLLPARLRLRGRRASRTCRRLAGECGRGEARRHAEPGCAGVAARAVRPLLLIPGTSSVAHLEENMTVLDIELDAADLEALDGVKPVKVGH